MSKSAALAKVPAERQAALIAAQHAKMARSAHAYVRGNTVRFYSWLRQSGRRAAPSGPPVWICGDCHVGNLGPVANAEGKIDIQIRDLDQTVIGNPAHDLIRMALSLATAARGSDLPGVTTAYMMEHLMEGYEKALTARPAKAAVQGEKPEAVRVLCGKLWRALGNISLESVSKISSRISPSTIASGAIQSREKGNQSILFENR